jgi:hypothetical protein
MADRVDAEMDAVKLAARTTPARRGRAYPCRAQILGPDQSMLPGRDLGEERVGWCRSVAAGAIV